MISKTDERKGTVKTYWQDIRNRVAKVEPRFAKLVDQISPSKNFPIYLVYLPYGALKGDDISSFIPRMDGSFYRLNDPSAPKEIIRDLGYGMTNSPLGMVLEKNLEYFINLKNYNNTIPSKICNPGTFFSFPRHLHKLQRIYATNRVLSVCSGARSTFLLPNIGCMTNHLKLEREYGIHVQPAKRPYDHWNVFRSLTASPHLKCDWKSCIMYFSENWVKKIHNDPAWQPIKLYLLELAWEKSQFDRNRFNYETIFSVIRNKRNLKLDPYLADTAQHLFRIALGDAPGYSPATNEDLLPLKYIENAFVSSYGIKKYSPIIMQPKYYNFENEIDPIYYSLQTPSTYSFSPKTRKASSTLTELRELKHIISVFKEELANENSICSDSVFNTVAKQHDFDFYHNEPDKHNILKPTSDIPKEDSRFIKKSKNNNIFPEDGTFLRGCIRIKKTTKEDRGAKAKIIATIDIPDKV